MTKEEFEVLRQRTLGFCDEVSRRAASGSAERLLQRCRDDLRRDFMLVVCGEFSRGKSSLLNALTERPGLFPVGIEVTTSVVTELRWGEHESAEVVLNDRNLVISIPDSVEYLTEQDNPVNMRGVRLVRLTAPVDLLRPGLVLVDTPGIGSLNLEHATATYAYLGMADAVIFVGAADERMSTPELDYLACAIDKCPVVITVLAKADKLYDPGPATEARVARDRISARTGRPRDDVTVIAVSARRKREALAARDRDRLVRSRLPELEETLWEQILDKRGRPRLDQTLVVLQGIIRDKMDPLELELRALSGQEEIAKVQAELEENRRRATELEANSASWRKRLAKAFDAEAALVKRQLADDLDGIRENFVNATLTDSALDDPAGIVRKTAAAFVDAAQSAGNALRAAAQMAAESASAQTMLPLTANTKDISEPAIRLDVPTPLLERRASAGLVQSASKSAAAGAGIGAAMGAAIGALILPGVGAIAGVAGGLVGQVVGLFAGLRDYAVEAKRDRHTARTTLLTQLMLPKVEKLAEKIQAEFAETVAEVGKGLEAQLAEQILIAREYIAESLAALEMKGADKQAQWDSRHEAVSTELNDLKDLKHRLEDMRHQVGASGGES
jgi:Dynamin family